MELCWQGQHLQWAVAIAVGFLSAGSSMRTSTFHHLAARLGRMDFGVRRGAFLVHEAHVHCCAANFPSPFCPPGVVRDRAASCLSDACFRLDASCCWATSLGFNLSEGKAFSRCLERVKFQLFFREQK